MTTQKSKCVDCWVTMSKRKIFEIIQLAAYYEKIFSDEQISMYAEDLEPLTDEETIMACRLYRKNGANAFFPRPVAKLVELIKKPLTNEDQAQLIVSSVFQMFKKHGEAWSDGSFSTVEGEFANFFRGREYLHRHFNEAVFSEVGPVGFMVIHNFGGWKSVCKNIYESPEGVVRAQLFKLALASLNQIEKAVPFNFELEQKKHNVLEFKIKTIEGLK